MKSLFRSISSMILINILIILSTITLHELGHALSGKLLGCAQAKAVIYDTESANPYTELVCYDKVDKMYLSGLALTTLFGISFLTFDDKPNRYLSIVIIGFGIFLSSLDVFDLTGYNFFKYFFMIFGLISFIIGQILYGLEKSLE
ncbi:MAG: hypothetical protein QXM68_03240 [Candidatus Aenigmatarchaeota archaeon]|nr:hypothetical protein [Candidatus Aenigmarchaeota archaeon]